MNSKELKNKIESGKRITHEEALSLFSWELYELGHYADLRTKIAVPGGKIGFIIDRIINYTNICSAGCLFCAYHSRAGYVKKYELTDKEIIEKAQELVDAEGTQIMLQGGMHPDYKIDKYVHLVKLIKDNFPGIYLHSFSPAEIIHIANNSEISISKAIKTLKDAGLNSIPGASDLLVERIRNKVSPKKISVKEWLSVIRSLKELGMTSTATMTYGMGESLEEKIEHLNVIREIQDETKILNAFIPWSFSPKNTQMEETIPATGVDYLKIVAISRIYLDNIKHIQAGWLTEGMKLAQIALSMGANDMGGVLTEEIVVKATGVNTSTSREEIVDLIRNSGKIPVLRDSQYNILKEF